MFFYILNSHMNITVFPQLNDVITRPQRICIHVKMGEKQTNLIIPTAYSQLLSPP